MDSGIIIADRYRLERLAGAGGMGSVYKVTDLQGDRVVAVKLAQHLRDHGQARRFIREAQVLAGLDHPHIVKYIDHGVSMTGAPFLVMEWLEGEDLAEALEREPLTETQTLTLGRNVCSALSAAHAHGMIHRDLKPGNLFLLGGSADRVKLIDFGVVRRQMAMSMPTKPGTLIGTPGFIAPEQARGEPLIDQRVDLYSLGAVMFACLTARPPFEGHQLMAVLAKLLIEPAPRVTELRRDVSTALDNLIARLLAKHAEDRPANADEVAALLEEVASAGSTGPRRAHTAGPLSHREQRVFSVLLLGDTARPHNPKARQSLASLAGTFDANLQQLMDGSMVAVFSTDDEPGEMATRAARCALAFHGRSPGAPIVVATGRGLLEEHTPVGRIIDDAVSLLFAFDQTHELDTSFDATATAPEIIIDDATAALIEKRFELIPNPEGRGQVLIGEAATPGAARKLLGKETSLVGRDREFARLEMVFEQCVIEMTSRIAVIEGEAGAGKSRLAHEFIKSLRQSGRQLAVWTAHGESIRQESPLGMLAALLRRAMQIPATAAPAVQRERIRHCVAERVAPDHLHRVAPFLGEIMGVRFPDNDHVQLHEARRDPGIMRDLMQNAWDEFLAAEAEGWPVLLVLEDVQWSDRASLRFIDMALRSVDGRSVMVVATALPDHERLADLGSGRPLERIHLGPLSPRACMELALQVLPASLAHDAVIGLAERCGGNPFYLEELLRGSTGESATDLPDAILVMVSARLRALSAGERRALRAASVFGTDFWVGGVASLLGDEPAEVSAIMNHLCDRELVVGHLLSRFEGQAQYGFHHDLLRDAAYASLTDEDRIQAHRGAGEWLEDIGETDAAVLAEHHWRGKGFASALPWYRRAAEHALEAEDLDAVIHLAGRAVDCGAGGEVLGALQALQAEARNWMMEPEQAMQLGINAMKRLSAGSDAWAGAGHQVIWAASSLSDIDQMVHTARQLIEHVPEQPSDEYLASLAHPALHLRVHQRGSESRVMVGVMRAHVRTRTPGPLLAATLAHMNGILLSLDGMLDLAVTVMSLSVELWTELGSLRHACLDRGNMGEILCSLGQYEQGIDELWRSVTQSRRADFAAVRTRNENALALALARTGAIAEARRLFAEQTEANKGRGPGSFERLCRAELELFAGEPERAYQQISDLLCQVSSTVLPHQHVLARALAAQALLALGRPQEALDEARTGLAAIGSVKGYTGEGEVPIRLAYAEALHASGHEPEARGAITEARRRLLERAEFIANLELRQSFLDRVAENHRTLELADAWQ